MLKYNINPRQAVESISKNYHVQICTEIASFVKEV